MSVEFIGDTVSKLPHTEDKEIKIQREVESLEHTEKLRGTLHRINTILSLTQNSLAVDILIQQSRTNFA